MTVIERVNARALEPAQLPYAPDLVVIDVSFISLTQGAAGGARLRGAARSTPRDGQAAVRGRARAGRQGRRGARPGGAPGAPSRVAECARALGAAVLGFAPSGLPGPDGQPRDVRVAGRGRPRGRARPTSAARSRRSTHERSAVLTHRRAGRHARGAARADRAARARGRDAGASTRRRPRKHGLEPGDGIEVGGAALAATSTSASCWAATGRSSPRCASTRARACRCSRSTSARSASSRRSTPTASGGDFDRAFAGEFETLELPTIAVGRPEGVWTAINDISVHRKPGLRVADLAYGLAGEEIGRVRCDGLVVATPQGSTGYNLANGGPVLAWGVRGLRRLLHRPALADRARAGRRARATC